MAQEIQVKVISKGNVDLLMVGEKCIAHIGKDAHNIGRYAGRVNHAMGTVCNNKTYPEAVEFIADAVERLFSSLGLSVKFA